MSSTACTTNSGEIQGKEDEVTLCLACVTVADCQAVLINCLDSEPKGLLSIKRRVQLR